MGNEFPSDIAFRRAADRTLSGNLDRKAKPRTELRHSKDDDTGNAANKNMLLHNSPSFLPACGLAGQAHLEAGAVEAWAVGGPSLVRRPTTGTPSGSLKSQEFSDRPTKSRIAGSVDQARRSAARVRSAGTPGAKKGRMSDPRPMDWIGGKLARSRRNSVAGCRPSFSMAGVLTSVGLPNPLERTGGEFSRT